LQASLGGLTSVLTDFKTAVSQGYTIGRPPGSSRGWRRRPGAPQNAAQSLTLARVAGARARGGGHKLRGHKAQSPAGLGAPMERRWQRGRGMPPRRCGMHTGMKLQRVLRGQQGLVVRQRTLGGSRSWSAIINVAWNLTLGRLLTRGAGVEAHEGTVGTMGHRERATAASAGEPRRGSCSEWHGARKASSGPSEPAASALAAQKVQDARGRSIEATILTLQRV
jgi:hypothetical protein